VNLSFGIAAGVVADLEVAVEELARRLTSRVLLVGRQQDQIDVRVGTLGPAHDGSRQQDGDEVGVGGEFRGQPLHGLPVVIEHSASGWALAGGSRCSGPVSSF
jgi:hypothetical protein